METDGVETQTSRDQKECEMSCKLFLFPIESLSEADMRQFQAIGLIDHDKKILLLRKKHVDYLRNKGLEGLSRSFECLDASRPWLIYWIIHSLELLDALPTDLYPRIIDTLKRCWSPFVTGGFGGGPMQLGHSAPTYASCLTLAILGTPEAYSAVDRKALYKFFLSLKDSATGGFSAHKNGEVDVRVTYCVVSIASLYSILTPELSAGVVDYTVKCQTQEGGFGGEPGNEAHGGYTFCAVATLCIMNALSQVNIENLIHWISFRQMRMEGGYQGRTNKLVDGCYSFWQGSVPAMIRKFMGQPGSMLHFQESPDTIFSNQKALQEYVLRCCQQMEGGLRDKPEKYRDHYHTCYCLSGLSISQYSSPNVPVVIGSNENRLIQTDAIYNIGVDKVMQIKAIFKDSPQDHNSLND